MKTTLFTKTGFSDVWVPISQPKIELDPPYTMRDWQDKGFLTLENKTHMIINAPMGSGKTALMCLLSEDKMRRDLSLRTIISVPQTIIAGGFSKCNVKFRDGKKSKWCPINLCTDKPDNGTINALIDFLKDEHNTINDRARICTHATLALVFANLKETKRLYLLRDLLLWIDEGHHLRNMSYDIVGQDNIDSNKLGELITYLLDPRNSKNNNQIGITTATFFRGDRRELLTHTQEKMFTRVNLPYDEYLKSMQYLRSFSFDFKLCGANPNNAIEEILRSRRGKDIIYIPHPMSNYSSGDKNKETDGIVAKLKKVYGKDVKHLDLVDDTNVVRKLAKKRISDDEFNKDRNALDAIVALGMFKEGANWKWADRSIIVAPRNSFVDIIQMIGRLFRDAKGKKHVEVVQLLPFSLDKLKLTKDKFRENLNNYLKAIFASLLLEDIFKPARIAVPKGKKKDRDVVEKSTNWLNELLSDANQQNDLMLDVSKKLVEITSFNKEAAKNVKMLFAEYKSAMPAILEEYEIDNHHDEIIRQVWFSFARRSLNMSGIDVSKFNFDMLQEMLQKNKLNPISFLMSYTSGVCTINTFDKMRLALLDCREERWLEKYHEALKGPVAKK